MTACYLFKFTVTIDEQTQRITAGNLVEEREFASREEAKAEEQSWLDADENNVSFLQVKSTNAAMNESRLEKIRQDIAENPAVFFGA